MVCGGVLLSVGEGLAWAYNDHYKDQKLEKIRCVSMAFSLPPFPFRLFLH